MFPGIRFNTERMRTSAGDAFSTATDIAEYLVKKSMPFRKAHEITGRIVLYCITKDKKLEELTMKELGFFSSAFGKDIYSLLKAEESVKNKKSAGSTAPAEVLKQIRRLGKIVGSR
jgi:argininosuccinate lyase